MAQTVTYTYPVAGTTPPTQLQALGCNAVVATLTWADSEVSAAIVHNFKVSAAQLANLFPLVSIVTAAGVTTTLLPTTGYTVAWTDSSTITIGKTTVVGTQGTLVVTIFRPMSTMV